MKKLFIFFYLFAVPAIYLCFSCNSLTTKDFKSDKFDLRQLVSKELTSSYSSGSYFLIAASYSSGQIVDENVKMFIKVDGRYKLLDLSLRSIRININDSISVPYIQIEYISTGKLPNEYLTEWSNIMQKDFIPVLYCPEKYLPAKLLPIELK